MKKTIFSDSWGEIVEYTRYRGKRGRYVSDGYARRALKSGKSFIKTEREQWRLAPTGKRLDRISLETPDSVIKKTVPGTIDAIGDDQGDIYEALRQTNLFTQVGRATGAYINIRGRKSDGTEIRLQGEIKFGQRHQDLQLMMAVKEIMADSGFRTYYELSVVRSPQARAKARRLKALRDTQFTITLYS